MSDEAAMGALFGGTIPRWYRRMLRQAGTVPAHGALGAGLPAPARTQTAAGEQ